MQKFGAIEGLRGWLAWTVVFDHLTEDSGFATIGLGAVGEVGYIAVLMFTIISGFVITHLVCERPEPYTTYLLRRFMRIFPLFAVTCVIGFFAQDLQSHTLSSVSYAGDPKFTIGTDMAELVRANYQYFWQHVVSHLTMLHGVFSTSLLPSSQYAFNVPAWSISLEWQFYLLAPFAIMLARRPDGIVYMALPIAVAEVAWRSGWMGQYPQPSCLPAAAAYFAIGIASRLLYPSITGRVRNPRVIVALIVVICPLFRSATIPLLAWVIVLAALAAERSDAPETLFARLYKTLLDSRLAHYFGSRSYSVYLGHSLVIALCHWAIVRWLPALGATVTFFCLSAMTVPLTIGVAEMFYRGVEQPGIVLGSRLARQIGHKRALIAPGQ